jgi:hypothetical protein
VVTPTFHEVSGATLKAVLVELQKLPEWGTGGGNLGGTGEGGEITASTTNGKSYTIEIHGEFFMTLPKWTEYDAATPAQKASWDTMLAALRKHEEEHVAIAHRNANALVKALKGSDVMLAAQKVADSQTVGPGRAGRLRLGRQDRPRPQRLRLVPQGRARHLRRSPAAPPKPPTPTPTPPSPEESPRGPDPRGPS